MRKVLSKEILNHPHLKMINDYEFRLADIIDEISEYKKVLEKKQKSEKDVLSLIIEGLASKKIASEKLKGLKREIAEDHIEMLRFFLGNVTEDLIWDLKEILNLLIRRIEIEAKRKRLATSIGC